MQKEKSQTVTSKIFFILLLAAAIVVIIGSLFIVNTLKGGYRNGGVKPTGVVRKSTPTLGKTGGSLSVLLEDNQEVKINQNLKAKVVFDSLNEKLAGVDAILTFDPKLISVAAITPNKELFDQIIVNQNEKTKGRIKITAYSPKKAIQGKQDLAFLTIVLLKNQPAVLEMEFLGPGKITDSNLVSQTGKKDILTQVYPLHLTTK